MNSTKRAEKDRLKAKLERIKPEVDSLHGPSMGGVWLLVLIALYGIGLAMACAILQ